MQWEDSTEYLVMSKITSRRYLNKSSQNYSVLVWSLMCCVEENLICSLNNYACADLFSIIILQCCFGEAKRLPRQVLLDLMLGAGMATGNPYGVKWKPRPQKPKWNKL